MNLPILRQNLRQQRRQLSFIERDLAAQQATEQLIQSDLFKRSRHIACYLAFDNELDTQHILQHAVTQGKSCYLPIVNSVSKTLSFYGYCPGEPLRNNQFGIPEPLANIAHHLPSTELDLILLPVVGFDDNGHRLGTGGGYYDRTLHFMQQLTRPAKPYLVGLAYEFQKLAKLPAQAWDVTLDGIITEQNIYSCR